MAYRLRSVCHMALFATPHKDTHHVHHKIYPLQKVTLLGETEMRINQEDKSFTITACDSCAAGICNDDWTHIDMYCQCKPCEGHAEDCEAERIHGGILASLEQLGWLSYSGEADMLGYFACYICSDLQCGGGHNYEGSL